jgi:hypothetical protein
MSLNPRHKSGRPILDRKQTLAPISTRHNLHAVPIRQLFQWYRNSLDTGTSVYYNIHDPRPDNDDNLYRNDSITSRNVINFDNYRKTANLERLSARNSGSHPSTLRPTRSRRLGSRNSLAREQLSARRRLTDRLQRTISTRSSSPRWAVLSDWFRPDPVGQSISEYQSRSESLRRIRETTLDTLNRGGGWR